MKSAMRRPLNSSLLSSVRNERFDQASRTLILGRLKLKVETQDPDPGKGESTSIKSSSSLAYYDANTLMSQVVIRTISFTRC